jgi:hypothetical protein
MQPQHSPNSRANGGNELLAMKLTSALALAALATLTPQSTLLRRDLKSGADRYEVKISSTTTPPEGSPSEPHTVKVTWSAVYKLGDLDADRNATLEVAVTDFTFGGEGVHFQGGEPPKTRTAKTLIDERNRINPKNAVLKPMESSNQLWLVTDHIPFPEKEVKVGDTWEVTLPTNTVLGAKVALQAKLAGEEDFQGQKAWVITAEGKGIKTKQPVKISMGGDPQDATVTGVANATIKVLVEKSTGRTLSLTAKVHNEQQLEFEGAPAPTPSTVDYTATMTLKTK